VVLENVLQKIPDEDLSVHVVWTPVLKSDHFGATAAAQKLIPDLRALHYWDGDQHLGKAYGAVLELPRGRELAWDIYFAYDAGVLWGTEVPPPSLWAHQLGSDSRHLGDGARLRQAVRAMLDD
jgi:hypothetical protein